MRSSLRSLKPTSGISHFLHQAFLLVLPAAIFVLVRLNLSIVAAVIVVLSKWRMFAVRPRFWPANIRANAVDLMVGMSSVLFIAHYDDVFVQLVFVVLYAVWLLAIKPGTSMLMITAQAFIGQLAALSALYLVWADGPTWALTALTGMFCFWAARHFLDAFDEPYAKMLAYVWGYFGAALAWLLCHWLLYYRGMAMTTLLLSTLGYGIAGLYYLDHTERLSQAVRRQFIFVMLAIVIIVLAFSDWGDKVV